MPTVTLRPSNRALDARLGEPLRALLVRAGVELDYPCGGKGTCRQCRLSIEPATESGRGKLPQDEATRGVRLACQAVVEGDCIVTIPEERIGRRAWKLVVREEDIRVSVPPSSRRLSVPLPRPSLEDQRPDWERFSAALGSLGVAAPLPDPASLEELASRVRAGDWTVEAIADDGELVWLAGADHALGLAVDLGTTTVDLALLDLETGALLGRAAFLNRQVSFGADVVSRAQAFHAERAPVRRAALETIEEGAWTLLSAAGAGAERILKTVVVGNPIMIHILNGIDPFQLTMVPYLPVTCSAVTSRASDLGWTFQQRGSVTTLPLVSAYVGADTVAMMISLDLAAERGTSLAIDIGTNGEMVLARRGELITTSTAAGPAFEGAEISCGMRALEGAITGVAIREDGTVGCSVVGGARPRGICGTGLVSAVAALLDRGVIDATGRFAEPADIPGPALAARLFQHEGQASFALSDDRRVFLSQGDVRKLQLAKGAVRTGIETLLEVTGVSRERLDSLRLAGNFGAGLDARAAMRIGLIPELDPAKVKVVGNAALRGAVLALLSRPHARAGEQVARAAKFVELGGKPEFQMRFAEAMMF